MASISDWAAARVTPGFSRPMTVSQYDPRALNSSLNCPTGASGTQNSASSGWAKPSGITPSTSCETPLSMIVRPMMDGFAPNRRVHSPCERITTRSPPACPLTAAKARPLAGDTPSVSKKSGVTRPPRICAGSPLPVSVTLAPEYADIRSNDVLARRQSSKFGYVATSLSKP